MVVLTDLFQCLLGMSLAALPVMAVVLVLRLLLCRAPKKYGYLLWAVVAFRLICPVSVTSPVGLVEPQTAERGAAVISEAPLLRAPVRSGTAPASRSPAEDPAVTPGSPVAAPPAVTVPETEAPPVDSGRPTTITAGEALALLWLAGLVLIAGRSLWAYARLRRRLATAVRLTENVWQADGIDTPFVLGWLQPRIYIPFRLTEEEQSYVLLHERTHLRRGDPWWKLLAFGLLAVYWWDPAAWLCYFLFCRDMEMSCDEAVLRQCGDGIKRTYSLSLVSFAAERRFPAPSPLAFGENDAKNRVRNILRWKRARPAVVFLAVTACLLTAVVCGTNAASGGGWVEIGVNQFTYHVSGDVGALALYEEISVNGREPISYHLADLDLSAGADGTFSASFFASDRGGEGRAFRRLGWSVGETGGNGSRDMLPTHLAGNWNTWSLGEVRQERLRFAADGGRTELYRCSLTGSDGSAEVKLYLSAAPNQAGGSWARRSSDSLPGRDRIDYHVGRAVQSMALYLDTYEDGQLISSQLQTEVLDFGLTRSGTLTLRVSPDTTEHTVRWDVEQGSTVLLRLDQPLDGDYATAIGSMAAPDSRTKSVIRNDGIVLYTLCLSKTDWVSLAPADNDLAVQLRLVLSSEERSWVKPENMKFTCHLTGDVQTLELYEEVYVDGVLVSAGTLMETGGTELRRDFWLTMGFQSDSGIYSWYCGEQGESAETNLPCGLPEANYQGVITSVYPASGKCTLPSGQGVTILAQTLWREGRSELSVSGYPINGTAEEQAAAIAAEDAVVLLKLRTGTGTSEYDALARRLAALWSPNVNDMVNTNAILSALYVGRWGAYIPDVPEPGVLRIAFQQQPEDPEGLNRELSSSAAVLLALIGNLAQVQWSCPGIDDQGQDIQITYYFTQDNAGLTFGDDRAPLLRPYQDLKDCGKSQKGLAALLTCLYGGQSAPAELARQLYDLRLDHASADGVEDLLDLLDVERWGEYRLNVNAAAGWSQLEIFFYQEPGVEYYDALDEELFPRALLLCALIDDLNGVSWAYPYRTDLSASQTCQTLLTSQMADSYAYTLLYVPESVSCYREDIPEDFSVKDCGASPQSLQTLLTAMGWCDSGPASALAQALYAARNDPDAILSALGAAETLGNWVCSDSDSEPSFVEGSLIVKFLDSPADPNLRDTLMWKYSVVLLALSERYNQTVWYWADAQGIITPWYSGPDGGLWNIPSAMEACGLPGELMDYGASPAAVQILLTALGLPQEVLSSCRAVLNNVEIQVPWFRDSAFDQDALPQLTALPVDTLIFAVDWAGDTLTVAEDYYAYPSPGTCVVERETYTLARDRFGRFALPVQRRNDIQEEHAIYRVQGQDMIYAFLVWFPTGGAEPFTDILGYDGLLINQRQGAGGWSAWVYYGREPDGTLTPIAHAFGELHAGNGYRPEAWAVDLDGDGVKELVANVTYSADGARRAYVYQRRSDGIYVGSHDLTDRADFDNWGVNAWYSGYDPEEGVFWVHYDVKGRDTQNVLRVTGMELLRFYKWEYLP